MDYKYLNKFIDFGVEKAMRHHKFNDDEIVNWLVYFTTQDPDPVCAERWDPDPVQNRTWSATLRLGNV